MKLKGFSSNKFELVDHLCRFCSGRLAMYLGSAVTGGGNPIWICASCETQGAAMGPDHICWCGQDFHGKIKGHQYRCYRIPDKATALLEEINALGAMGFGFDWKTTVIGVVSFADYNKITAAKVAAAKKP